MERDETMRKLQSEQWRVRQLEEELKNSEMRVSQAQLEAEDAVLVNEHVLGASRAGARARVRLDSSGARSTSTSSASAPVAHSAAGDGTGAGAGAGATSSSAGTCACCDTHLATIDRLRDELAALRDQLAECARKKDAEYALLKKDFLAAQVLPVFLL